MTAWISGNGDRSPGGDGDGIGGDVGIDRDSIFGGAGCGSTLTGIRIWGIKGSMAGGESDF